MVLKHRASVSHSHSSICSCNEHLLSMSYVLDAALFSRGNDNKLSLCLKGLTPSFRKWSKFTNRANRYCENNDRSVCGINYGTDVGVVHLQVNPLLCDLHKHSFSAFPSPPFPHSGLRLPLLLHSPTIPNNHL